MSPDPGGTFAVIAAGGTGGHVLPGLAVARALVERGHAPSSICFFGSARGVETTLVPDAGFELVALAGRGIERRVSLAALASILAIASGTVRGALALRRRRPRVVVVLGGYASVPCIVGAVLWRVPMVVVARDARAGAADRLAGRFARAAAVPFAGTELPRAVVTGNPVRAEVLTIDRARDRGPALAELGIPPDRALVAVFTGSLGARRVNEAVRGLVDRWAQRGDVAIRHVTGVRDYDEARAAAPQLPDGGLLYQQVRYEDRLEIVLAAADVAVTRAGGATVAELTVVGLPAILVPLPIAPRDHQTANAEVLVRGGAAVLVPDAELDVDRLERELATLLDDRDRLARMGAAAAALGRPDAAARVADLVEAHAR